MQIPLEKTDGLLTVTAPEPAASDTPDPVYTLDELLAGVTEENRHGETDMGPRVGKEVW